MENRSAGTIRGLGQQSTIRTPDVRDEAAVRRCERPDGLGARHKRQVEHGMGVARERSEAGRVEEAHVVEAIAETEHKLWPVRLWERDQCRCQRVVQRGRPASSDSIEGEGDGARLQARDVGRIAGKGDETQPIVGLQRFGDALHIGIELFERLPPYAPARINHERHVHWKRLARGAGEVLRDAVVLKREVRRREAQYRSIGRRHRHWNEHNIHTRPDGRSRLLR